MRTPESNEETLRSVLRHPDPPQLWFQIREIAGNRCYLRHGVRVAQGDVVFDVGANVGVAAAYFAACCGAGTVHAFEPVAPIFDVLRDNLARFDACTAHPYGLGARVGSARITYYPRAAAMSSLHADPVEDRERVRRYMVNQGMDARAADASLEGRYDDATMLWTDLRALSEVIREHSVERIDLLKIDVERAELEVLDGIDDEHWRLIRQVVVEVHEADAGRAVADRLQEHGLSVAEDQEAGMSGTPVRLLYATRAR